MFRPFSAASSGGWINPAAGNAFSDLANGFRGLSKDLDRHAHSAVTDTLVQPAIEAGAHPSTQAFFSGDSLYVGVPPDHPDAAALADNEYGTLTQPAGGQIRQVLRSGADESFQTFQDRLAGK